MRRNYFPSRKPQKQFITTYHINQVPLPYYNPLEDPNLKLYFSHRKVSEHLNQMKLLYKPRQQYPYLQRRAKNAHKFLKPNLCEIPPTHILPHNNFQNKSCMERSRKDQWLSQSKDTGQLSPVLKRKSESEILGKVNKKYSQFADLISSRPKHNPKQRNYSPEIKSKSGIFRRRNPSSNKKERDNVEEESQLFA